MDYSSFNKINKYKFRSLIFISLLDLKIRKIGTESGSAESNLNESFKKTQISQILSLRSPEFLEQLGFDGEPYGSYGEDDPRDESTKPGGENSPLEDLPEHVLEGAVLWTHSGDARRQSHGARPPRRNLRRQPKADSLHVSHFEDAPDPA